MYIYLSCPYHLAIISYSLFDKYININFYPELVDKGIYRKICGNYMKIGINVCFALRNYDNYDDAFKVVKEAGFDCIDLLSNFIVKMVIYSLVK